MLDTHVIIRLTNNGKGYMVQPENSQRLFRHSRPLKRLTESTQIIEVRLLSKSYFFFENTILLNVYELESRQ